MTRNGNWFNVKDCDGKDLELNDWVLLTHTEHKNGAQFFPGHPARIADVVLSSGGVQVEVELQQERILVPPEHLKFHLRHPANTVNQAAIIDNSLCPVCGEKLGWFGGGDYCDKCHEPLWEIKQGLAKKSGVRR